MSLLLVAPRMSGRFLAAVVAAAAGRRPMGTVAKGTTRAAVHGSRSPATTTLQNKKEVEAAVKKGREQKHKAREEVEDKVDASIGGGAATAGRSSDHRRANDEIK